MQKHLQASLGKTNYQFVLSDVKASNSRDETPIKRARLYSLTLQSLETVLATTYDRKSTAIEIKSAWKTFTNDVQEGVVADDARYEGVTIQYPSLELKIP